MRHYSINLYYYIIIVDNLYKYCLQLLLFTIIIVGII